MKKICTICKVEKPLDEFYNDKRTKDNKYPDCKVCRDITTRKYHKNNRESIVKKNWLHRYKGTVEQYEHYLNVTHCECCGREFTKDNKKHQDHNHNTGEVRKVLCNGCNAPEGYLETPENAYALACYMASNLSLKELINGL